MSGIIQISQARQGEIEERESKVVVFLRHDGSMQPNSFA